MSQPRFLLTLTTLLALTLPAQAATLWYEDFEGLNTVHNPSSIPPSGNLAGQNGWQSWATGTDGTATVDQDGGVEIGGSSSNGAYSWIPQSQRGNYKLPVNPGDIPGNGTLRLSGMMNVGNDGNSYAGLVLAGGGDPGTFALRANAYSLFNGNGFALQTRVNNVNYEVVTPNLGLHGLLWFEGELEATLAAGQVVGATFRYRDVNQAGASPGAWSQLYAFDLGGTSGWGLDRAGFIQGRTHPQVDQSGRLDNLHLEAFAAPVPEPTTSLLGLLALGALGALRRNRG